jgi:hypothetical protein
MLPTPHCDSGGLGSLEKLPGAPELPPLAPHLIQWKALHGISPNIANSNDAKQLTMPFAQLVLGSPGSGKSTYCDGSASQSPSSPQSAANSQSSATVHGGHREGVFGCQSRSRKRSYQLSMRAGYPRPRKARGDYGRGQLRAQWRNSICR